MAKPATEVLAPQNRISEWVRQPVIVVGASLLVALCARITLPLPFTPVPLTLQNFGVLLVGLLLGSRRGFAALALYLLEGAAGLPVFNPMGPGGIAQLIGPTGGFLLAYPFVAALAGWLAERGPKTFARCAIAATAAELLLFAGGTGWLFVLTHSASLAVKFGLYAFVFAEVLKIMSAAAIAGGWQRAQNHFHPPS
jgi:biotin transport system substrate-specific component